MRFFYLVSFPRNRSAKAGIQPWDTTSRLVVERAIARHVGKQQGISPILAIPGENPSQKNLRIQQFASLSTMNSLCDGTGN
jgi:hypothetical protein